MMGILEIREPHEKILGKTAHFAIGCLVCLLIMLQPVSGWSDPVVTGSEPTTIRLNIGFTSSTFVDINRNDALAAIKVWADVIGEKRGHPIRSTTAVFDDGLALVKSLESGQLDLITLDAWLYVSLADSDLLLPVFVPVVGENVTDKFLILAHRDSGITAVDQLQGASLSFLLSPGRDVGRAWMEDLLVQQNLPPGHQFFGSVEDVEKLSAAMLPVFFGKRDACVVDRAGFETMSDLNPQVGRQLTIVAESPPFIEKVVCLRRGPFGGREDLVASLAELHTDPRGEQILMVFKIDRLVPFEPSFLDHVIDLARRKER